MYLLDTHVLIWALFDSEKLPDEVRKLLNENSRCISIVSLWEMAIKNSLGKLKLPWSIRKIAEYCEDNDIEILHIKADDCEEVRILPFIHRDPFDRIIVAQARTNDVTIITKDGYIPQYDVKTIW